MVDIGCFFCEILNAHVVRSQSTILLLQFSCVDVCPDEYSHHIFDEKLNGTVCVTEAMYQEATAKSNRFVLVIVDVISEILEFDDFEARASCFSCCVRLVMLDYTAYSCSCI